MGKVKLYFGFVLLSCITFLSIALTSCVGEENPEGAISCCECLENPAYDTETTLFGTVHSLGELNEPLFILDSGGKEILVRYDSMVEDDGTEWPAVSIAGIENGDNVIVTGELKREGKNTSLNDFWANSIKKY